MGPDFLKTEATPSPWVKWALRHAHVRMSLHAHCLHLLIHSSLFTDHLSLWKWPRATWLRKLELHPGLEPRSQTHIWGAGWRGPDGPCSALSLAISLVLQKNKNRKGAEASRVLPLSQECRWTLSNLRPKTGRKQQMGQGSEFGERHLHSLLWTQTNDWLQTLTPTSTFLKVTRCFVVWASVSIAVKMDITITALRGWLGTLPPDVMSGCIDPPFDLPGWTPYGKNTTRYQSHSVTFPQKMWVSQTVLRLSHTNWFTCF